MTTPYQPSLPPEGAFTDAELSFIEESPPNLFPENQNSNFGFIIRKTFTDLVQELITQQNTLYNERFVDTSQEFLDEWERMVGLPPDPVGITVAQRRLVILGRLRKGGFTRTLRRQIVESFIQATFGEAVALTPAGVPLTPDGVPLYSGVFSLDGTYTIVENIPGFSYDVKILTSITVDLDAMARELARVTPAGISFTVTPFSPDAGVEDYGIGDYGTGTYSE